MFRCVYSVYVLHVHVWFYLSVDDSRLLPISLALPPSFAPSPSLRFVTGVIACEHLPVFERVLWRACRGNVFLRSAQIEEYLEDPNTVCVTKYLTAVVCCHVFKLAPPPTPPHPTPNPLCSFIHGLAVISLSIMFIFHLLVCCWCCCSVAMGSLTLFRLIPAKHFK